MKKAFIIILSAFSAAYTVWYMSLGSLTENSGALSKTGLTHPIYFAFWGVLVFSAIYINLLYAYNNLPEKHKFQYYLCAFSAVGMILTLTCDFDYAKRAEYFLHCAGSLSFSVLTGICGFLVFLLNYRRGRLYAAFTYIIGAILITDLILLILFKETALIEAAPVLFALVILPVLNFTNLFKEKIYAAR